MNFIMSRFSIAETSAYYHDITKFSCTLRYPLYNYFECFYQLHEQIFDFAYSYTSQIFFIIVLFFMRVTEINIVEIKLIFTDPFYCYLNGRDLHKTFNCTRETLKNRFPEETQANLYNSSSHGSR